MDKKTECKLVQDLLPNYIEKLTSEETNVFIEKHLKSCEECTKFLNEMNNDLEIELPQNDDKEVDYIKKYNHKLKSLKLALILIPTIIVILLSSYCLSEVWTVKAMRTSSWYINYNTEKGILDREASHTIEYPLNLTLKQFKRENGKLTFDFEFDYTQKYDDATLPGGTLEKISYDYSIYDQDGEIYTTGRKIIFSNDKLKNIKEEINGDIIKNIITTEYPQDKTCARITIILSNFEFKLKENSKEFKLKNKAEKLEINFVENSEVIGVDSYEE